MNVYLHQNDQQTGPFSEDQVRQMVRAGLVTADTMGWKEGMASWQPVSSFITLDSGGMPAAPATKASPLGLISLIIAVIGIIGWSALLIAAGIAHNNGTATKTFNMIVGFLFLGGIFLNILAFILGIVGAFKTRANTLAIIGACLNGLEIVCLIGLMILGLSVAHAAH